MSIDVLGILKVIVWPLFALVALFVFKRQLVALINKVTEILGSARNVSIGPKGIDITIDEKLAALNTRVTTLQATQEIAKQELFRRDGMPARQGESNLIPASLQALVAQYKEADGIDSRKERVRRKNEISAEMGAVSTSERVRPAALIEANDEVLLEGTHPASTPGRRDGLPRSAQAATAVLACWFAFQFQGSRSATLLAG